MSHYTVFVQCAGCHKVLAPIYWARHEGADIYRRIDSAAEAHAITCPYVSRFSDRGAPLREHPAGEIDE